MASVIGMHDTGLHVLHSACLSPQRNPTLSETTQLQLNPHATIHTTAQAESALCCRNPQMRQTQEAVLNARPSQLMYTRACQGATDGVEMQAQESSTGMPTKDQLKVVDPTLLGVLGKAACSHHGQIADALSAKRHGVLQALVQALLHGTQLKLDSKPHRAGWSFLLVSCRCTNTSTAGHAWMEQGVSCVEGWEAEERPVPTTGLHVMHPHTLKYEMLLKLCPGVCTPGLKSVPCPLLLLLLVLASSSAAGSTRERPLGLEACLLLWGCLLSILESPA